MNAWLRVMKRYDDLSGLTKTAPVKQIGLSAAEWDALIDDVVGTQPRRTDVIDIGPAALTRRTDERDASEELAGSGPTRAE